VGFPKRSPTHVGSSSHSAWLLQTKRAVESSRAALGQKLAMKFADGAIRSFHKIVVFVKARNLSFKSRRSTGIQVMEMRRSSLAVALVSSLSFTAAGCRQTTGINAGGPLTPIGPASTAQPNGTLSPLGTGQSPALGPFGGNTRVTPPSTGSYVVPNNYMGGGAPAPGSASYSAPGVNPGLAPGARGPALAGSPNEAIGSGLAVTGWTESGVAPQQNVAPANNFNHSATVDPRSGGMRVTDLTSGLPRQASPQNGAAAQGFGPQGFRPQASGQTNGVPQGNFNQPNRAPRLAPTAPQLAPVPRPSTEPISSPAPQLRPINPPPQSQIATEPNGTSNLQWRRPGTF